MPTQSFNLINESVVLHLLERSFPVDLLRISESLLDGLSFLVDLPLCDEVLVVSVSVAVLEHGLLLLHSFYLLVHLHHRLLFPILFLLQGLHLRVVSVKLVVLLLERLVEISDFLLGLIHLTLEFLPALLSQEQLIFLFPELFRCVFEFTFRPLFLIPGFEQLLLVVLKIHDESLLELLLSLDFGLGFPSRHIVLVENVLQFCNLHSFLLKEISHLDHPVLGVVDGDLGVSNFFLEISSLSVEGLHNFLLFILLLQQLVYDNFLFDLQHPVSIFNFDQFLPAFGIGNFTGLVLLDLDSELLCEHLLFLEGQRLELFLDVHVVQLVGLLVRAVVVLVFGEVEGHRL